ncbi:MAG: AI-2E family transporter [Actinomycetia bacterium]|nr:AI-2E family transporter [Actinomycetes bacterium]
MDNSAPPVEPDNEDEEAIARFYPPSPPWGENAKLLVVGMAFVLAIVGVYLIRNVLAIVALAALVSFLVAPLIRLGEKHLHIPRGLALLLAYVLVFVGTLTFGALLASSIVQSVIELDPFGLVDEGRIWLLSEADVNGHVVVFGLTVDISAFVDSLQGSVLPGEGDSSAIDAEQILNYLGAGFAGVKTAVGIMTALITSVIITTLVAMYLNADSRRMHKATLVSFPPGYERDGYMMMAEQKSVWRGYLYGQLINSLITGLFVFVVLWAVGLPGAFLMGMIMVVLNMIPTFGPILAAIPGVLAALLSGSTRWPELENYWFALVVIGIYLLVVQLQANIIAPRVMGTAVNLRPAVILIGLMVGFQVGGLLGSLLAVPVIASIRDVGMYLWRKLIDVDPWPDAEPVQIPSDP